MIVFVYEIIYFTNFKKMMCYNYNGEFKYKIQLYLIKKKSN